MDNNDKLNDIFNDDPFGLLQIQPKTSNIKSEEERLVESFEEINEFFNTNKRIPENNREDIKEHQLFARLNAIRNSSEKVTLLKKYDIHNLLSATNKTVSSITDVLTDDDLGILSNNNDSIFKITNVPIKERADTDFVARRKICKDFSLYENLFKEVQNDLKEGKRVLADFQENQLKEGRFFVHNGILLLLEKVFNLHIDKFGKEDGRTRIIFENGTESNMKLRSLGKNLFINGKAVTQRNEDISKEIFNQFNNIEDNDKESGFIYVLRSKSQNPQIFSINNLFKIGYSNTEIPERIKNAEKEPTYLFAEVKLVKGYKCYNLNPQKLEQLLHNFFGKACLNIDIYDEKGNRHIPREWFIAPLEVIDKVIKLIINGDIISFTYDVNKEEIVLKKDNL